MKNKHNHNVFQTREHSNDINRKNERLFVRLQEIHSVSLVFSRMTETDMGFDILTHIEKENEIR